VKYGLRKSISNLYTSGYAKEDSLPEDISNFIDCSSGINPFGFSSKVEAALQSIPSEAVNLYPESSARLKEALTIYWQDIIGLKDSNILLGSGSIDIIYKINKLFISNRSKVLGYSPQFSDYIDDIKSYGGIYEYNLMTMENNFKFMPEPFLEKVNKHHKLIYIDNPNNPTGQVIPLAFIEEVVKKAHRFGVCVVIDEAYGDFMDNSNSAIVLLKKYNNIFIVRTFSKGLGLAGVRGGYLVTSDIFADYYNKVSNPYVMNGIANYLAVIALKDIQFIDESREKVKIAKTKLIESLQKFTVLETDSGVPIMTIKHPDPAVDLVGLLKEHNILAISGEGFIGLDKSFSRLRIPSDIDMLVNAFANIQNTI